MPHPLGSSRSHPAPQELISCPTCLPGWWTSRTGTRPCGGVGVSLDPGTSTSLLIRFSSCRQRRLAGENTAPPFAVGRGGINAPPAPISCDPPRCRARTFPTGDSDSSHQEHLAASVPFSSPRPRLKRAHKAQRHGVLLCDQAYEEHFLKEDHSHSCSLYSQLMSVTEGVAGVQGPARIRTWNICMARQRPPRAQNQT